MVQAGAKGKYVKHPIEASAVTDVRLLQIPLVAAERAWAYAMDIKNEIEQSQAPYKRRHMIKRLSKAHVHAKELASLVGARSLDARAAVEADAYLHWMAGTLYLEKGRDWQVALQKLGHAQNVLNELSKVSDYEQRVDVRFMLDKIEPAVRFCEYQLTRAGVSFTTPKGGDAMGAAMSSKFKELSSRSALRGDVVETAASATVATTATTAETNADEVHWNGEAYPVAEGRCKAKVQAARGLVAELEAITAASASPSPSSSSSTPLDEVIQLHDRVVNAYASARSAARAATQLGTITEAQQLQLMELVRAINGIELEWTIKRNRILASAMEDRLNEALLQSISQRSVAANHSNISKEKPVRPDELVRTYDNLVANVTALNDLAAESGGAQGEILMDECAARIDHYKACRCYFIAHKYLSDGLYAEAHGLFGRCLKRCATAASLMEECAEVDMEAKAEVSALADKAKAFSAVCVAEHKGTQLEQSESAANAVRRVSLHDTSADPNVAATTTMTARLGAWESFVDASGARISSIPPAIPFIPVRPIVLDGAIVGIEPPNLDHRAVEEPRSTSSVVSKLFGW